MVMIVSLSPLVSTKGNINRLPDCEVFAAVIANVSVGICKTTRLTSKLKSSIFFIESPLNGVVWIEL